MEIRLRRARGSGRCWLRRESQGRLVTRDLLVRLVRLALQAPLEQLGRRGLR